MTHTVSALLSLPNHAHIIFGDYTLQFGPCNPEHQLDIIAMVLRNLSLMVAFPTVISNYREGHHTLQGYWPSLTHVFLAAVVGGLFSGVGEWILHDRCISTF